MDTTATATPALADTDRGRLYRKVAWRLLPFLMLCYAVAYLDRVNVGYAKLGMAADLGLSEAVYGLGAGIFFIGYFLFEVPSNVLLHRLGARTWIARIMISWSLVSGACALIGGPVSFYIARFLLGVAEAGFFPGIILYLTYWFPSAQRGRIIGLFMVAIPLAGLFGGPLSGWLMEATDGWGGAAGWRWMFALEALPAFLLGCAVPFVLTSRVSEARWLSEKERAAITADLAAETPAAVGHGRLRDLLADKSVRRLSAIYFCCIMGQYGITFWLPTLLSTVGDDSPRVVGLMSALPYACAVLAMISVSRHSDKTGERRWHLVLPMALGALAMASTPLLGTQIALSLVVLSIAAGATLTATPLFWNLPTAALSGAAAAVGIALINSVGNLAGFISPLLVGWISTKFGSAAAGLLVLAAFLLVGAGLVLADRGAPHTATAQRRPLQAP